MESNFYRKILRLFLMISIIPTVLIGVITVISMKNIMQNQLKKEAQHANKEYISSMESLLNVYTSCFYELDNSQLVLDVLKNKNIKHQKKFYEKAYQINSELATTTIDGNVTLYGKATNMHIINAQNGDVISLYDTPDIYVLPRNENWGFYRRANQKKDIEIYFNRYEGNEGRECIATIIKPYYEHNSLIGYLAMDIPEDALKGQRIKKSKLLPVYYSLVTEHNYVLWNDNEFEQTANFIVGLDFFDKIDSYWETDNILITVGYMPDYHLYLLGSFNMDLLLGNIQNIWETWILVIFIMIVLCLFTTMKVTKTVMNPLHVLVSSMKTVEEGNLNIEIELNQSDEFGYVAEQFNKMCKRTEELFNINQEKQRMLRIAELKHLQSQINPHFLYNTLNSIMYLAKMHNEKEIYTMTKGLSSLLKGSLNISKESITLGEALNNMNAYIAIQKIRFSEKFDVFIEVSEQFLDCEIPNLILQPIVENAIIHGLEPIESGGMLYIKTEEDDNILIIAIRDTGCGMSEAQCKKIIDSLDGQIESSHIGLKNVHQRLKLLYGEEFGIEIDSKENEGTTVFVKIPYMEKMSYDTMLDSRR